MMTAQVVEEEVLPSLPACLHSARNAMGVVPSFPSPTLLALQKDSQCSRDRVTQNVARIPTIHLDGLD